MSGPAETPVARPDAAATPRRPSGAALPARPAREAPAPEPLHCGIDVASHRAVRGDESVLAIEEIQGNVLGGFNKDFQTFLFLEITDAARFRHWLNLQTPFIATSAEVLAFNRLFKAIRSRRKRESNAVKSTWFNLALSYRALKKLEAVIPGLLGDDFADGPFRNGLAAQSAGLGDPTDPAQDGHPDNWVVGGPANDADVILMVASDNREDLGVEVARLEDSIYIARDPDGSRTSSGVRILFKQNGANLPGPLGGHEHFGFLDGVSQPGLRGLLSDDPTDVLTPRQNPDKRDQPPVKDASGGVTRPGRPAQGKPGQDLLWPGEFVFGYPRQNGADNPDWDGPNPEPGPNATAGPDWARNGSFLVFRRLRQDVHGFHRFLNDRAKGEGLSPGFLGAKLVGRWQSGAPVVRVPNQDDRTLANDDCANNNFEFQGASPHLPATPGDPFACEDLFQPPSPGDQKGERCPFTGHIRKAYPRDDKPIKPAPGTYDPICAAASAGLNESDTQTHRLLRRGIPFGEASASTPERPVEDAADRGLLFFAYQTSIERQFEFVTKCWVNNPDFKEPFGSDSDDPLARGGHDPIIGQNNGGDGTREFTIADPNGAGRRLSTRQNWVIPTGGGYFFAPSLSALREVLSTPPPTRDEDA